MRAPRIVRYALATVGAAVALASFSSADATSQGRTILAAEVRGAITPVVADYLREGLVRAEREGHDAFLVTIDTPGGLDAAMRDIVQNFLNARVPVIVWVAPAGARAASAGAVIALSSHVVAMAPGTNIGAATPVSVQGAEVGDKVVNDATAYVVAIAELRGRDEGFARDIVREGRSERASRAARIGAVDLLAGSRASLLDRLDGREIELANGDEVVLRTRGAAIVPDEMGFVNRVRQRLADPNLAFLFLSLGTLAIVYEFANPGMGFGGIAGFILVLLGMFGLSVLPINVVGVVLLLLALGLFVAEVFVPGVGVLAAGGAVSLVLAGIFLVRGDFGVDLIVILPTAVVVTAAVVIAGRLAWRARRMVSATGTGLVQGGVGEVRRVEGERGQMLLEGAWWQVRADEPLHEGQLVRVKAVEGLLLLVEPAEPTPATDGGEEKA